MQNIWMPVPNLNISYAAGLNIYFWLSFIPAIVSLSKFPCRYWDNLNSVVLCFWCSSFNMMKLVMLVGTKLQHVVSLLALEIVEPQGPSIGAQVKPRDDLFWFGKPDILLRLLQFISFQVMHIHACSNIKVSYTHLFNSLFL